jgi:hypothetical protein
VYIIQNSTFSAKIKKALPPWRSPFIRGIVFSVVYFSQEIRTALYLIGEFVSDLLSSYSCIKTLLSTIAADDDDDALMMKMMKRMRYLDWRWLFIDVSG